MSPPGKKAGLKRSESAGSVDGASLVKSFSRDSERGGTEEEDEQVKVGDKGGAKSVGTGGNGSASVKEKRKRRKVNHGMWILLYCIGFGAR